VQLWTLLQDEVDDVLETWNDHCIRRSRNPRVPSGRPNVMFSCSHLYAAEDQRCAVDTADVELCRQRCTFRVSRPCEDEEVYELCLAAMTQNNLSLPNDVHYALDLYRKLRLEINALL